MDAASKRTWGLTNRETSPTEAEGGRQSIKAIRAYCGRERRVFYFAIRRVRKAPQPSTTPIRRNEEGVDTSFFWLQIVNCRLKANGLRASQICASRQKSYLALPHNPFPTRVIFSVCKETNFMLTVQVFVKSFMFPSLSPFEKRGGASRGLERKSWREKVADFQREGQLSKKKSGCPPPFYDL